MDALKFINSLFYWYFAMKNNAKISRLVYGSFACANISEKYLWICALAMFPDIFKLPSTGLVPAAVPPSHV